jgi:hypothetical protein
MPPPSRRPEKQAVPRQIHQRRADGALPKVQQLGHDPRLVDHGELVFPAKARVGRVHCPHFDNATRDQLNAPFLVVGPANHGLEALEEFAPDLQDVLVRRRKPPHRMASQRHITGAAHPQLGFPKPASAHDDLEPRRVVHNVHLPRVLTLEVDHRLAGAALELGFGAGHQPNRSRIRALAMASQTASTSS